MLKMMTTFQGLPGEQPVPGPLDFPRSHQKLSSTSEGESEASMSQASSEDLAPPLEMGAALERDEEETVKKEKKKSKGLAKMFNVFKGKKKKSQPSPVEQESEPKASPALDGGLPTVEELKADLEQGRLEAARPLLALERELLEAAAAGGASDEELVQRQSKVEALYVLLRDQVLGVLRRPLEAAPERLRQALAVVAEQEREDRRGAAGPEGSTLATMRPRRWLQLWRRGVAQVAEERLGQPVAAGAEGRSEAERTFLQMGRTMKEDLEAVVERLKPLFPAEFDVVTAYAESYHECFAAQVAAMAQFELCERDTYMLLVWVQNLYPNDIISSPKLAAELQEVRLGSLLPPEQIQLLEATFLSNEVANVKELIARALELESQHWAKDVPPHRLDGHCHSELAIDVIQIISQGQVKAESITADLGMQIKQVLLLELVGFFRSYQRAFDEFLERYKQLKNYRANVIANINNCLSFRMSAEQRWQTLQDTHSHLLAPLNEIKSHGFDSLLQNLFLDLKPLFKRFTQTRWTAPVETLEEILTTVSERLPEFSELQDCFREEIMEAVHLHLVKEYIIRLSKRRLVLKTAEQQQHLAGHILSNADLIQRFCTQNGSPAAWLSAALPRLAEIIRLQDLNAIKIEVATYATWYPDFSKGHLNAILAIKGNLSSGEARSIRGILDISTGPHESAHPLFSLIKVG
ncbi:tumor necrosis factor alpha-induced protein 2 [Elephas maximus indicus]|uniref:tumor necrosis factor alpha-induced protein 2 n=1 Tax=Elephas maximus indicus TaxID=99487 RepID=UPI0021161FD8|nr:tumor necrosis factor alpha-induced protein 2 [Elephas maximus indicus]XP_049754484.1 tumor necrosis factor alpha-induced protein 2 [Elephas maximus indicus]